MKKLLLVCISLIVGLFLVLTLTATLLVQQQYVSKSELTYLYDLTRREGLSAAIETVRSHLYGVDLSNTPDPSYDRKPVAGRGHTPWVIRSNLDNRPRILLFALAPKLWAAYDTENVSLYQVWRGNVSFDGAVYNYQHGPQPSSTGEWYLQDSVGTQWFLDTGSGPEQATLRYLGHEYSVDKTTAALRFQLTNGDTSVVMREQPELTSRDGTQLFTRTFTLEQGPAEVQVSFTTGKGLRHVAAGTVEFPLTKSHSIVQSQASTRGRVATSDERARGESVIAGSDCLSCHGENHRIAGPAWSQVASKFRGKVQREVVSALTHKVRNGSVGVWGNVPMPPHPNLSEADARAAVTYVLSVPEAETELAPPLNDRGEPYQATTHFEILPKLTALHPSFHLENLAPPDFQPKVGGLAFRDDGKLLVASWDSDGAVFLVDPAAPIDTRVQRIAEGLHEPLGMTWVDGRLFVLQKQELTELIDLDGDGSIDRYSAFSFDWPANSNFHSFAFGLLNKDKGFYFLLSICVLPGGASCPEQLPTQGKLLHVNMQGQAKIIASGFRTPNGIAAGPGGEILVTDNQGDWLPASKVVAATLGDFFGSRAVPDQGILAATEKPPIVWLPQDEIGNSPTQSLTLIEGPYAGQLIHGDVYNGGLKRVFVEQVEGQLQGAAFHFSAGLQGPINRIERGPDDAIYLGIVGNPPNWGEYGKPWHGLQRLSWRGNEAFEITSVHALPNGFELRFTQPLAIKSQLTPEDLIVKQWFYHPNERYGGPKYDESQLRASRISVATDRRSIRAIVPGLQEGYVVYLRLNEDLKSALNKPLWTSEAWYTLNRIPKLTASSVSGSAIDTKRASNKPEEWQTLFDGNSLDGWRNYGGDADDVRKWRAENGELSLRQTGKFPMWDMISSLIFGGQSGDLIYYRKPFKDFELQLEWKISKDGNSGIFYLVRDETEKTPWRSGIEMQVLDNDGHSDGKIETHRAGDLYDLIAANPVTVRPPGEWNEVTIKIKDNLIEHWLNGSKVVSVVRGSKQWSELVAASKFASMPDFGKSPSGYIVLQDHGDPVWYRNIRIREL